MFIHSKGYIRSSPDVETHLRHDLLLSLRQLPCQPGGVGRHTVPDSCPCLRGVQNEGIEGNHTVSGGQHIALRNMSLVSPSHNSGLSIRRNAL